MKIRILKKLNESIDFNDEIDDEIINKNTEEQIRNSYITDIINDLNNDIINMFFINNTNYDIAIGQDEYILFIPVLYVNEDTYKLMKNDKNDHSFYNTMESHIYIVYYKKNANGKFPLIVFSELILKNDSLVFNYNINPIEKAKFIAGFVIKYTNLNIFQHDIDLVDIVNLNRVDNCFIYDCDMLFEKIRSFSDINLYIKILPAGKHIETTMDFNITNNKDDILLFLLLIRKFIFTKIQDLPLMFNDFKNSSINAFII